MGFLKRLFAKFSRGSDAVRSPAPPPHEQPYCIEGLESRCLLTAPYVTDWDYIFDQAQHALVVQFSENVTGVAASDLRVDQVTTGDPDPVPASVSYNSSTNTATFTFSGVLDDGHYRAVIERQDVRAASDNSMMAMDAVMEFSFLRCDIRLGDGSVGRDNWVNLKDWNAFTAGFQGTGPWTYMDGDFNYDGIRNLADFNLLAGRFGNYLPQRVTGPGMVSVSLVNDSNTINLNWEDSNPAATGYRIQRSTDGQNFSIYEDVLPPYQYSSPPGFGESAPVITWRDNDLLDGTRYWYRVRAFGNGQDTGYTPKKAATTKLAAPGAIHVLEVDPAVALLTWVNESLTADGFKIFRSDNGGTAWTLLGMTEDSSFEAPVASWTPEPLFKVRAYRGAPNSPTIESVETVPAPVTPVEPTVLEPAWADPNPITGHTTTVHVLGDTHRGESFLTYTWHMVSGPEYAPKPLFVPNGTNDAKIATATFFKAGTYVIEATIANGEASTTSTDFVQVLQTPTSMNLNPFYGVMPFNGWGQFYPSVLDQFGDGLGIPLPIDWTLDPGSNGSLGPNYSYHAPALEPANAMLRATSGSISGSVLIVGERDRITFDELEPWTVVTTQIPRLTISGDPTYPNKAIPFGSNISIGAPGGPTPYRYPLYVDFDPPIDALQLKYYNSSPAGTNVATVRVFEEGQYSGDVAITGGGGAGGGVVNGTAFERITRIEAVNIMEPVTWDDFVFKELPPDLDVDSNNDGVIDEADDPFEGGQADEPGVIIRLNDDDDDHNGIPDLQQTGTVSGENDLVPMNITAPAGITSGTITLRVVDGPDHFRVWSNPDRGGGLPLLGVGSSSEQVVWNIGSQPSTLWIEGVRVSSTKRDVEFALVSRHPNGRAVGQDRIVGTVATVTISLQTINQDDPTATTFAPLEPESDGASVLYGGSEPSTADDLRLTATLSPAGLNASSFVWTVSNPDVVQNGPPATTSNPTYTAGNVNPVAGAVLLQVRANIVAAQLFGAKTVEIGVRTDSVTLVGWINPAEVPLYSSVADARTKAIFKPDGTVSSAQDANTVIANLSQNWHTDVGVYPGPIWLPDRVYILHWMFKYGGNADPTTVIPGGNFRNASNERIDFAKLGAFFNVQTNYKLVNHLQIKYRVSGNAFKGNPTVLHSETLIGTTKNPCGPWGIIPEFMPGQVGPADKSRTGVIRRSSRLVQINDGSPDKDAIRAFNTLMGKATEHKFFWENIGSKITFSADGGTEPQIVVQRYPTYYEYHNGALIRVHRQWGDPRGNFNAHPYPFGTVPSQGIGGITPGGRNGDAESSSHSSARIPAYVVP